MRYTSMGLILLVAALPQLAKAVVLLDVRTPSEIKEAYLEGSKQIDFFSPDFHHKVAQLKRDERYVVYCRSGGRSAKAVRLMRELGFRDVVDGGSLQDAARLTRATCQGPKGC